MSYSERYLECARIFEVEDELGLEETELAAAEQLLARRVPAALREFYSTLGAWEVNSALNHLLEPAELRVVDDHLLFYEDEEGDSVWGIPLANLADSDPPVEQGVREKRRLTWYREELPCSGFLVLMTLWQTLVGGLGFASIATMPGRFTKLQPGWRELGKNGPITVYTRPGAALGVVTDEDEGVTSLHLGAATAEHLESAQDDYKDLPWEVIVQNDEIVDDEPE